ncbi:hypothetical protein WMY93_007174 [Mugilogobius chulae]|uniref:BRCT domain-containing protein n=1 Tax=Mugilogobius chulae TaxID=88201 RepID=A0AAW0PQD1_9GOBI
MWVGIGDLQTPKTLICRGAPAGPVSGPAHHVCVPALSAPQESLVELIQLCGGTVCRTVRQAGLCIGKYNGRRPEGSRLLSEQQYHSFEAASLR